MSSFILRLHFGDKSLSRECVEPTAVLSFLPASWRGEAVALEEGDVLYDLTRLWAEDHTFRVVQRGEPKGLEILRHDAAHVMAQAVQEMDPTCRITIGPAIEDGFYYDFDREAPFSAEDLAAIEARMHEIVNRDEPLTREEVSRAQARALFAAQGEDLKVELIDGIPEDQTITLYRQGAFVDLCRGPHLPSTKWLGHHFRLTKVSGAYWRGDARGKPLQRIYGTAWDTGARMEAYFQRLEEAKRRDHRKVGTEMQLFHFQEEAIGSVFWHPRGWTLYKVVEECIRKAIGAEGYQEVNTPQLLDRTLWEQSGHWEKFRANMMTTQTEDEKVLAFKPMNCPCHVQIFKVGLKSYRDLPLRLSEFGSCVRYEPSGALMGLMRLRAFVQDDAHIFCTPAQIVSETQDFCNLLSRVYKAFGFEDFEVKFSDRPLVRAGGDDLWDRAEEALREGAQAAGLSYSLNPGEGAFYGPKLEFVLKDALGRAWQCGTLQVDFVLPERLDAHYVTPTGEKARPVMLHRAILGSLERFIGVLLEHHAGWLPLWLAPVQIVVTPLTQDQEAAALALHQKLCAHGIRSLLCTKNEKVGYKIRSYTLEKVPFMAILGRKEVEEGTVSLRRLLGGEQVSLALHEAIDRILQEGACPLPCRGS